MQSPPDPLVDTSDPLVDNVCLLSCREKENIIVKTKLSPAGEFLTELKIHQGLT